MTLCSPSFCQQVLFRTVRALSGTITPSPYSTCRYRLSAGHQDGSATTVTSSQSQHLWDVPGRRMRVNHPPPYDQPPTTLRSTTHHLMINHPPHYDQPDVSDVFAGWQRVPQTTLESLTMSTRQCCLDCIHTNGGYTRPISFSRKDFISDFVQS